MLVTVVLCRKDLIMLLSLSPKEQSFYLQKDAAVCAVCALCTYLWFEAVHNQTSECIHPCSSCKHVK